VILQDIPADIFAGDAGAVRRAERGERLAAAGTDIALLALFAGLGFVAAVATANRQSVTG
jgi:hypothetical protein